ncbi:uncharacterized protein LOC119103070 [Pollicipes pollicipes]|uniref:uncharacterized protein LOC119103070 n=1 Tax=Pollicipes pollicipes TaxID=41117 RepID=UPI001885228F|nr:uncharacterized protein LOC119103070 [Pollicipes pollicipes]
MGFQERVLFEPRLLLADNFAVGLVDVLIGANQLYSVLLWNQISLAANLRAIETVFGHVIHGQEGDTVNPQPTTSTHLAKYRASEPELCEKLEAGLYMDDVCTTFATRAEADQNVKKTADIFSEAGMNLRELRTSAVLGCRLMDFVKQALHLKETYIIYWTDSMDVLYWLQSKKTLEVFVQNRLNNEGILVTTLRTAAARRGAARAASLVPTASAMAAIQLRAVLLAFGDLRVNDVCRYMRRRLHLALRSPALCLVGAFLILLLVLPLEPSGDRHRSLVRRVRSAGTGNAWDQYLPLAPFTDDDDDVLLECTDDEDDDEALLAANLEENSKCKVHLLMFGSSRLGNLMIKYSMLYALREKYKISVYTTSEQANNLNKYFPKLSIKSPPSEYKQAKWHFTWYRNLEVLLPCPETIGKRYPCFPNKPSEHCIVVADWPPENGFPVFSSYLPRLSAEEFIFDQAIQDSVHAYFRKVSGRRIDPVIIGVHVRGTDQNVDFVNNYHRNLPSTQYFATALAYYRAMYKNAVFVVATDEPSFAVRSVVNKFGDVYYTSHKQNVKDPVAFDMAMLSLSNHTVISVGSFGFWGSYLCGGMVVAPSQYIGEDPSRYDLEVKHWDRQKEWFSWS